MSNRSCNTDNSILLDYCIEYPGIWSCRTRWYLTVPVCLSSLPILSFFEIISHSCNWAVGLIVLNVVKNKCPLNQREVIQEYYFWVASGYKNTLGRGNKFSACNSRESNTCSVLHHTSWLKSSLKTQQLAQQQLVDGLAVQRKTAAWERGLYGETAPGNLTPW